MSVPHTGFIVAAYAITFGVVAVITVSIAWRHRTLRRALASLESRAAGEHERA